MSKKEEFYKWWLENGSLSRDPAMNEFKRQNKPIEGIGTSEIRLYVKEFKAGLEEISNIEYKKSDIKKEVKPLLELLRKEQTLDNLIKEANKTPRIILAEIEDLKDQGYNISFINNKYFLDENMQPEENIYHEDWNGNQIIKFGIVSDTHLCSKHQQITFLKEFYRICKEENIKKVYHVGDITDGYYTNRNEQIYELFKHGVDEQAQYVIDNYPDDVDTDFIIGNHDTTHIKNGGANIGKRIQLERKDMKYLGSLQATVNITPNCKMELRHPLDGTSYSLSYKPQKYVESITGGEKPNILLIGHYHKLGYFMCRNIHTLLVPSMESQTAFMKGKNLASEVGGIILTIHVDKNGTVKRFLPEFIPCYKHLKNDY